MSSFSGPNASTNNLVIELDVGNFKSFSPNVHPKPLDIYGWTGSWGAYEATLSRDYTTSRSPANGIPMLITTSGSSAYVGSYNSSSTNLAPAASGQTWTVSYWVKGSSNFTGQGYIFGANSAGNYVELNSYSYSVTTQWSRVSYSYTMSNASTVAVQMRFDCYNTGVNMWVDGLQVEKASAASNFSPITNTNGTAIFDLSGNNQNGILFNSPTQNSTNNGSLTFNGTSHFISVANSSILNPGSSAWTVSMWFNPASAGLSGGYGVPILYNKENLYEASLGSSEVEIAWQPDWAWYGTTPTLTAGTWYHTVHTYNNATQTIYLNGTASWSQAYTGSMGTSTYDLGIGCRGLSGGAGSGASSFGAFTLGRFSMYNRAFYAQDVAQEFNSFRKRYGI